jgi:segregation and condensation protein B
VSGAKSVLEAILFAAPEPVGQDALAALLPDGSDVPALLAELSADYDGRGIHLVRTRRGFAVRTRQEASDLAAVHMGPPPRLTRAALETLASIAVYDAMGTPLTRSEIERVRGVSLSAGITDTLLAMGYVRLGRRRDSPGRPLTWVVTDAFHDAFGLQGLEDLGSFAEMRDAGLAELKPLERAVAAAAGESGEDEG